MGIDENLGFIALLEYSLFILATNLSAHFLPQPSDYYNTYFLTILTVAVPQQYDTVSSNAIWTKPTNTYWLDYFGLNLA